MKNVYYLLIISLFACYDVSAQTSWGRVSNGQFTNEAMDVETDNAGNSYIAGYITGETAFGTTMIFPTAQGNGDIYVAKYNVSGTLVWVQRYGGTLSDRAYDLAIDNNGNILVTGAFAGTVDFGGHIVTSVGNTRDIFLLKMDNQGNVLWAISEGGSGVENAYGVTCDSQGNVILTGQFQGNTSIGGQTFNSKIDPTTNLPSFDLFISKYNSSGVFQWVKTGSAKYEDRGMSVTTDAQNDIYLTGQFSDTLVFAGQTFNNGTYNVGLLAKLSSNGNLKWFNTLRSSKVLPYSVKFDGENVLIAGDCGKNFTYSNNNSPYSQSGTYAKSIFLLKVAPNGAKVWLSTLGSDNDLSARALAVTSAREIYVTGYFACTWTEFHQPLSAFYNSVGFKDAYLWKADKNGNLKFVKTFGSKLDDVGNGVAILSGNTPVICGGNTGNLNIPTSSSSFYDVPTNDNFALRQYPNLGYNFVYLRGDKSLNSFLTTAVNDNTPAYNYFENQPNDSLFCEILPNGNPIHFCVKDSIWISAHTLRNVAPDYTYLWNTSETTERILVNTTGTYWANITREDGCSSGSDTLNVVIEQKPAFPLMSDSLGLAVNLPVPYYSYHFCYPDSVAIWFNNLSPNTTIKLKSGNQIYTDTLPHYYSKTVEVIITDSLCTSDTIIPIIMDYTSPSTYNPYLTLVDKIDYNDSISVCSGTLVGIENHDWNNNPNDSLGLYPDVHYVTNTWKAFLNNTLVASSTKMHGAGEQFHDIGYYFDFKPLQTGNYVIQLDAIIGYDNLCGLDTTHYTVIDTFYIEVLSNPAIPPLAISGDNMLCPNGSLYLSLDTTVAGFAWEGPAIQWQSVTKDTIQITKAGTYTYSGSFVDTTSGCKTQGSAQHIVYEKQPPIIQMYPADGVVCPYDSVTMWVDTIYQSYNWTSPQASNVSNVFYHKDELLGFYYVTVIDDEGCELTSPMAEIKEFTTPYLYVEPENVICQGQSTTIKVQMDGEGYINWLNPVSGGSNSQVVVTEAGWYYCELSQCGITTIDSIQILDGSFTISLNIGDTTICSSETVVLIAPSGYSSYEWSNGEEGISTIAVEDAGAYSVTVENDHGCKATSPAAKITTVSNEPPNDITDIHLCNEGNTVITSTQAVVWYDTDKNIIGNGTSIYVSAQSDTTFLYSFSAVGNCPIVYKSVSVHIAEPLPLFQVFGDTTLCFGQDLKLWHNVVDEQFKWYRNTLFVGANDTLTISYNQLQPNSVVSLSVFDDCNEYKVNVHVKLLPITTFNLAEDTLLACPLIDKIVTPTDNTLSVVYWQTAGDTTILTENSYTFNGSQTQSVYVWAMDENNCPTTSDTVVFVVPNQTLKLTASAGVHCYGDSVLLTYHSTLDSVVFKTPHTTINNDSLWITMNSYTAGKYSVEAWDTLGCFYKDSIILINHALPTIPLSSDTILCLDDYFGNQFWNENYTIIWNNQTADSVAVTNNSWYEVTVMNNQTGCVWTDSIYITAVNCTDELPNVFTPNGDGINDYFVIDEAIIYPNNYLLIFNRWGEVVYETHGYKNTFDGTKLMDGTYFYRFYHNYKDFPEKKMDGFFHILR